MQRLPHGRKTLLELPQRLQFFPNSHVDVVIPLTKQFSGRLLRYQ
jgi:hypothetical protein